MAIMEKSNQEELNTQNQKKENKFIWLLVAAIFLVLALGFFVSFLIGRYQQREAQKQYEELAGMTGPTQVPAQSDDSEKGSVLDEIGEPINTPAPQEGEGVEEGDPVEQQPVDPYQELRDMGIPFPEDKTVDFEYLQTNVNEHIYAWIYIPGTNVDYPVLRHPSDNSYYLNHNLDGSKGYPGCIYTENFNNKDWMDPMTVLYGHDMRSSGTMFHELHKFEKEDFFEENQYIYIYTPERLLVYHIFAAFVHNDEHLLLSHNFYYEDQFTAFMDKVLNLRTMGSHIRKDEDIHMGSKIITLSTCIKNKPNNRYFVQGVLLNE